MSDREPTPETRDITLKRAIYDDALKFARAGEVTWLGDYYRPFDFNGHHYMFQTTEPGVREGQHAQPSVAIARKYQTEDGEWDNDITYTLDPQSPDFATVVESIIIRGVPISELPSNPHDTPLHGESFFIRTGSDYTWISETIRNLQPLADPDELQFVSELANAAASSQPNT